MTGSNGAASHSERGKASPWRLQMAVLLAYALLAIWLTWPTVSQLSSHLPGDGGDDPAIAWNLWWVKHALLTLQRQPLISDYMFYPIGINLAFYTLTVLNALTALPITLNLGVVAASNLHVWFSMVVGGYGTFLLARQELGGRGRTVSWAAGLSGVFYAFGSSQLFYLSLGQFNIASSHWVPYVVLCVMRTRANPSLRYPALAALFLVWQAWAEMTYASFLLVFIVLYLAYEAISAAFGLWQRGIRPCDSLVARCWQPLIRGMLRYAFLFGLFLIGIVPLLVAMYPDLRDEGDFWVQGSGFAETFSSDVLGFLVPTMRHPLFGSWVGHTDISAFDKGQHLYLGVTLLALAVAGWLKRPGDRGRTCFWLIAGLLFAWLTLGPRVHLNGWDTGLPGPFVLLQALPFFKGNRYPSRYSVLLVLALAMLAARGARWLLHTWAGWHRRLAEAGGVRSSCRYLGSEGLAACLLAAAFLFEHASLPLPQSDMRVPEPYATLATSGQGTLLDIPIAWRNGFRITGPLHPGFMFGQFYQTVHLRPLLQGNTSRNPEFKFQYFTQAPIINSLLALETGHTLPPERLEADRKLAADVLRFFDIQTIVVRSGPGDNPAVVPEATLPYIETIMPVERVFSSSRLSMYGVELPALPSQVEVSAQAPLARLYLGEGWAPLPNQEMGSSLSQEPLLWAQRHHVRLLVPLQARPYDMSLRLYAPAVNQQLRVQANGQWVASLPIALGWGEYTLELPAGVLRAGLNDFWLSFDQLQPVTWLPHPADSGWPVALVVCSAGEEVGDFGHIYLNGQDVSPNQRGYNVAAIGPQGELQVASFDTHLQRDASTALAAFIRAVPAGHVVAVAAADEASMHLSEQGVAALRAVGIAGDLRGKFRWSHAAIGVKGNPAGSALEALDELQPVCLAAGVPVTRPEVAAALAWIRFEGS